MSRKKRTHLRGTRGQAFADKIRGIPLDRILCVSCCTVANAAARSLEVG